MVLAAIGYLAFAAIAPVSHLALMPLNVALFYLGRVCFFFGHGKGIRGRAFGYAVTFLPTFVLYFQLATHLAH